MSPQLTAYTTLWLNVTSDEDEFTRKRRSKLFYSLNAYDRAAFFWFVLPNAHLI